MTTTFNQSETIFYTRMELDEWLPCLESMIGKVSHDTLRNVLTIRTRITNAYSENLTEVEKDALNTTYNLARRLSNLLFSMR